MTIFSFHLAELRPTTTAKALWNPPTTPGLLHAECMALMQLGAPTLSPSRMQLRRMAMFARWDSETALTTFLADHPLGRDLAEGWHVRLQYLRRWSHLAAFPDLPTKATNWDQSEPVVAVTLARMRLPQLPRFLRWGKPVERLVRDHPATTLALAAMRPPRTISTFSIWHSIHHMDQMVHGHSNVPNPTRHTAAMKERRRKDFHHEFATLRFRPLSEHGSWQGQSEFVPR